MRDLREFHQTMRCAEIIHRLKALGRRNCRNLLDAWRLELIRMPHANIRVRGTAWNLLMEVY